MIKFLLLAILLLALSSVKAQNAQVVDSILMTLPEVKDQDKSPYYTELSWQYILSDANKSYLYAQQALQYATKSGDSVQLSDVYNTLGAVYMKRSNYDSALYFNEEALKIRLAQKDSRGIAASYSKMGMIYTDQGYFDKALDFQLKALKLFIESEDPYAEAQTYNNICQIYSYLDNFEMAIYYTNKCIKMYETLDYPYGEATAIANLALYYEEENKLDSAIYYTEKSIEIFSSINDWSDIANSENMLGIYLRKQGKNEEGLIHYKKAYDIAVELEDGFSIAQFMANIGATYLDLNQMDSSYSYYSQSLELSKEHELLRVQRQCYEGLSKYFELNKGFQKSLEYRKLFELLNDSIVNLEMQESMAMADAKFQASYHKQLVLEKENIIEKEQKDKAILSKENAEKESELRLSQLIFTIIISGFVLIASLIFLLINRKRHRVEKKLIEDIAREQELGLQKSIIAQEEERKRVARDLHDGVVQDIVSIKQILQQQSNLNKEELVERLDKAAGDVRALSHRMMPYALKELGLVAALEDLMEKLLPFENMKYEFDVIGDFENQISDLIKLNTFRIVQEMINNTMKHSKATFVSLVLTLRNGFLTLNYEDNGVGIDTGSLKNGLGLISIQSRVAMLKAQLKLETEPEKGVLYILKIPIS
ncbi:MAG: tetratricopeptide repeat protein [Flavobacteriales bacterium]|nr:tetratricopeptide repeat protein [Flavobacteriales bacterium]